MGCSGDLDGGEEGLVGKPLAPRDAPSDVGAAPPSPPGACGDAREGRALIFGFVASEPAGRVDVERGEIENAVASSPVAMRGAPELLDTSRMPAWLAIRPDPSGFGVHSSLEYDLSARGASVGVAFEPGARGTIAQLSAFNADNQALTIEVEPGGAICARFSTSPSDAWRACAPLSEGAEVARAVARLDPDAAPPLAFNLAGQSVPVEVEGFPDSPGALNRTLFVSPPVGGPGLSIAALHWWSRALDDAEVERYLADPASASDPAPLDPGCAPGSGPGAFAAASAVLETKCAGCHTGAHASWAGWGADDFINAGLATPGDLAASPIFARLRGAEAGPGIKNMPLGDELSEDEFGALRAWILEGE